MHLTPTQLEKITILAESSFEPWRIAFMLDIDPEEMKAAIEDLKNPASIAYYKGFYTNEHAVRESIMKLARDGSSPAQAQAIRMIENTKTTLRQHGYKSIDHGTE